MTMMRTTTRGWIVAAVAVLSVGLLPAQDAKTTLAKARVVEEAEHDLPAAAALYAKVIAEAGVPREVADEARLRLARVRQAMGDFAGAREALAAVVKGGGAAARAAEGLLAELQDPQRSDRAVELEILKLMAGLRGAIGRELVEQREQLVWFGDRAVPLLVEAVGTESDYGLVTTLAGALLRIGGAKVDAWIEQATRYEDPLRRRAVVRAAVHGAADAQKSAMAAFLGDPAAGVRLEAVESGIVQRLDQAVAMVRDEDRRVREATVEWLGGNWAAQMPRDQPQAVLVELVAVLDAREAGGGRAGEALGEIVEFAARLSDPHARLAVALATLQAKNHRWDQHSGYSRLRPSLRTPDSANLLRPELVAAARAVTARPLAEPFADFRESLFRSAFNALVRSWNRDALEAVYDLVGLGFPPDGDWFVQHLRPADWVGLFERLRTFAQVEENSHDYLQEILHDAVGIELPAPAFEPLRAWFEHQAGTGDTLGLSLHRALVRLGKFGTTESAQWAVRMLTSGLAELPPFAQNEQSLHMHRNGLFQGLITNRTPANVEALRELAVAEDEELGVLRNEALAWLAIWHDVESAPLFAKAYALGLQESSLLLPWGSQQRNNLSARGLGWLQPKVADLVNVQAWSDEETARAMAPALQLGLIEPWKDASSLVDGAQPDSRVFAAATHSWSRCPDEELREWYFKVLAMRPTEAVPDGVRGLVIAALQDASEGIRREALRRLEAGGRLPPLEWGEDVEQAVIGCLDIDSLRGNALGVLGEAGNPGLVPLITEHLDAESRYSRQAAVDALFDLVPDRALELTLDALGAPALRSKMIEVAKRTLDRRFVPLLIAALRDEHESTRKSAKEALDAIEFYVSQEQRWQRLLSDAGLESTNAAEALLKQAREAKDEQIRLTAIRSLGTLAVPETLPFLIQLMQDPDPDIAEAATTAVARINRDG